MKNIRCTNIAVMLDIEGTSDYIDNGTAKEFIDHLDIIRNKFNANYGIICISTHYSDSREIKKILSLLSKNLTNNIIIGDSFYLGGIYDYNDDIEIDIDEYFNQNKVATFYEYYINDDNKWFAIIDDYIPDNIYLKYKDKRAMLQALPSQTQRSVSKNNFMRIATTNINIYGVIDILDLYIANIDNLTINEILEKQKEIDNDKVKIKR